MTRFEEEGYTRASKFKVVRITVGFVVGDVVWIEEDDGSECPIFTNGYLKGLMYLPNCTNPCNLDLELIAEDVPKYPNPPHKYAELIKQWADGAAIEYYDQFYESWEGTVYPTWSTTLEYRVKPQKSEKDIQIEKLEADLIVAKKEMGKFYNEFMCYYTKTSEISERIQELKSNV